MSILKLLFLSFVTLFFILNCIFYVLLQYPCKDLYESITRTKYHSSNYPDPVDVVYTWVNGSDPTLVSKLNHHRRALYLDTNLHLDGVRHRLACPYPICGFNNHVLLSPPPAQSSLAIDHLLRALSLQLASMVNSADNSTVRLVATIPRSSMSRKAGLILHSSFDISKLFMNQSEISVHIPDGTTFNYSLSQVFITADVKELGPPVENCAFIHGLKEMKDSSIETSWRMAIAKQTPMNISLVKASSTSFLVLLPSNVSFDDFSLIMTNQTDTDHLKVSRAFLVVDTVLATVLSDLSESRYQDNEELKYSLRSLDRFLGFYRHIFIVTNGQVPSWLDTDHPKITVVSHSQIFPNAADIPTFNSAAIEANLHNIPGLAPHFIYLNDDVFFGEPVFEEDFYSLTSGYKVYLGWSVPDCVERCPNSWLADGFCDHECNVPECQWDAGDCVKTHGKVGLVHFESLGNHSMEELRRLGAQTHGLLSTCSQGCNHNWLADRYCDNACNVAACGYDLGDCGDGNLYELPSGVVLQRRDQLFPVTNGTVTYVLDLRSLIRDGDNVTGASIDDVVEVVASSYAVKYRLLIVLLHQRNNCRGCYARDNQVVRVNVTVDRPGAISDVIETGLVINARTPPDVSSSNPPHSTTIHTSKLQPSVSSSTSQYKNPQTLPFPSAINESSDLSISQLESLRPLDVVHYRLLLEDGLISLAGYRQLLHQLWAKVHMSSNRNVSLTAHGRDLRLDQLSWGFLPWERSWATRIHGHHTDARDNNRSSTSLSTARHPLDLYAESLRHSNGILSSVFGVSQRRVPAHGPHFVSTSILRSAHQKFQRQWDETSSHRFRTPFDVQFAFSYFYFLMSERRNVSIEEVLNRVDTDKSGSLDKNEMRSLALALGSNDTITDQSMLDFTQKISNSCLCTDTSDDGWSVNITELSSCLNLSSPRPDSIVPAHRFTTLDDTDLAFIMISTNRHKVIHDLDSLRKRPRKFFCLNDNLPSIDSNDHSVIVATVRQDLHDFLSYMFPSPSQFERRQHRGPSSLMGSAGARLVYLGLLICVVVIILRLLLTRRWRRIIYRPSCRFVFRNITF